MRPINFELTVVLFAIKLRLKVLTKADNKNKQVSLSGLYIGIPFKPLMAFKLTTYMCSNMHTNITNQTQITLAQWMSIYTPVLFGATEEIEFLRLEFISTMVQCPPEPLQVEINVKI